MPDRTRITLALVAVGAAVTSALTPAGAAATAAGLQWAPAGRATIHPGVHVTIGGVGCIAGFVLTDGRRVFLAVPATCAGVDPGQLVNGCQESQSPYGLTVVVEGARHQARLVYSSFVEMQLHGTTSPRRCFYDSLALVQLDRRDVARANPSLPVTGGPTGVDRRPTVVGDGRTVYLTMPTSAQGTGMTAGTWAHRMLVDAHVDHTATGAPVVDPDGRAIGMVTGVPTQGGPGETTVVTLDRVVRILRADARFAHVRLARGTQRYTPPPLVGTVPGRLS